MPDVNRADEIVKEFWGNVIPTLRQRAFLVTNPAHLNTDPNAGKGKCPTFWGTHGCDKKEGHKNAKHICRSFEMNDEQMTRCSVVHEILHTAPMPLKTSGKRYGVDDQGYTWELYG